MALNATEEERQATAVNDFALKMQLEARYKRELRELFAIINRDLNASVLETGEAQSAQIYEADFLGVISRQYRRVNAHTDIGVPPANAREVVDMTTA